MSAKSPPEVLETCRAQLGVAHGMSDRAVAEPVLDSRDIGASVGQRVSTAMPQYVETRRERQLGTCAYDLDQPVDGISRKGRSSLSGKDIAASGVFLPQLRKHAQFIAPNRMNAWLAVLGPTDMQTSRPSELNLAPFQLAGVSGAQTVTIGHED
jgi:hypothetical protein